jgi:hypothetical protein
MSNEPGGFVRTCCIAQQRITQPNGEFYTLGETSVRDIFHSEFYKTIRQEIREGKLPKNCKHCWQDEANGKQSKREMYNEYAKWRYDEINYNEEPEMPQDFQLILGTTCNIKCRTCNPNYSSKWVKESEDRGLPYLKETVQIPMDDMENAKFWTEMDDWIKDIKYLEIMGGEPLYMKEFKAFAEKLIERDLAKDIALNFSTNGTQLHTDLVGFGVSIDAATKERFEYLRHGAEWDIVSKNLDHFHTLHTNKEIYVSITCTVSAMNVMYLKEYVEVFAERWPNFEIFFNMVHFPSWFNSNVFEEFVKSKIVAPLQNMSFPNASIESQIKGIINHVMTPLEQVVIPMRDWSDVPDPNITVETEMAVRRRMFMQQLVAGDKYRGEDFRKVFPELHEIIKPYFDYDFHYAKAVEDPRYGAVAKGAFI